LIEISGAIDSTATKPLTEVANSEEKMSESANKELDRLNVLQEWVTELLDFITSRSASWLPVKSSIARYPTVS
jgi:hypothetical protein